MRAAALPAHAALTVALLTGAPYTGAQASDRDLSFPTRTLSLTSRDVTSRVLDLTMSTVDTVAVRETPAEIRIELPADILFDFDKATIRDDARAALASAAAVLRAHAGAAVAIDGHADSKGSDAHNQPLSLKRAEAVRRWLADREGVRLGLVKTAGFGSRRPAVPNTRPDGSDDPDGRQRNRRVEIVIAK